MGMNFRRISQAVTELAEGKGFALLVTVCIAVIVGSAVWSNSESTSYATPTPPLSEYRSAAGLLQQSLADLSSPTPLPTQTALLWTEPVTGAEVLTGFSDARMQQSGTTSLWALHLGVDLAAEHGDPVKAAADGIIKDCGISPIDGAYAVISHAGGYESRYTGMAALGAIRINDRIKAGQTIGFAGNGPLDETDRGPHVHVSVMKDQRYIDPISCWK